MVKLHSGLCQRIVLLYILIFFHIFLLLYILQTKLHLKKPTTKVKTYFQIWLNKKTDKYSTLDPHET